MLYHMKLRASSFLRPIPASDRNKKKHCVFCQMVAKNMLHRCKSYRFTCSDFLYYISFNAIRVATYHMWILLVSKKVQLLQKDRQQSALRHHDPVSLWSRCYQVLQRGIPLSRPPAVWLWGEMCSKCGSSLRDFVVRQCLCSCALYFWQ